MLTSILSSMIYALPTSVICAAQLFPLFCPEGAAAGPWIATAVFLAVCAFFRHGSLKIRLIIGAAILALSAGIFFAVAEEDRAGFFAERLWILLVLLIILGAFIAGELLSAFRLLRIACAAVCLGIIVFLIIRGKDPGALTCAMLFTIILSVIISEVQHYWKKEGETDERKHMVSIIPFIFLCSVLVLCSPFSKDPYGWPVANRIWQFAKDTYTKISQFFSSDEDYMEATIGFSSGAPGISGKLSTDSAPKEMFTVSFTRKETPSLNLGACGYNEFDGHSWSNSAGESGIGRRHALDMIETRAALMNSGTRNITDHLRSVEVTVTYSNLNTRYALLPGKYMDGLSQGALLETKNDRDNIVFAGKRGLGTSYGFSANMLNKNHKEFIDFLNGIHGSVSENEWYDTVSSVLLKRKSDYPYEEYLSYVQSIRENYYRNVQVSPELRERLDKLYDGCNGAYEKMLRVEAVLSRFTYTTSPGSIPEYVDSPEGFLDWFMLDNPMGYCSHFATAMVLLARAEGLPARYVEGFFVPSSSKGGTTVTDHNSHSWAEIYFEGFGFIPFDPTPGYASATIWQTASERSAYLSTLSKGSLEAFTTEWDDGDASGSQVEESEPEVKQSPALILIPTLMLALLFPASILLYREITKRRFNKLTLAQKSVALCHANMRLMRFLGAKMNVGETLREFAERREQDLPEGLTDFITIYEEISYSGRPLTDDMLFSLMRANRDLAGYASKKHRVAYFFYSLFTG